MPMHHEPTVDDKAEIWDDPVLLLLDRDVARLERIRRSRRRARSRTSSWRWAPPTGARS